MNKTHKRITREDIKILNDHAKKIGGPRSRLELKLPCFSESAPVPESWKAFDCPAIPIGVAPCDYDLEVTPRKASIPSTGKCWVDCQVCTPSGYGDFEPYDWFSAYFENGVLVFLENPLN